MSVQIGLGFMQFGFVAIYLSESFIRGFMTAAGLQILISVLKYIFGIQVPSYSGPLAVVYVSDSPYFGQKTSEDFISLIVIEICHFLYFSDSCRYYTCPWRYQHRIASIRSGQQRSSYCGEGAECTLPPQAALPHSYRDRNCKQLIVCHFSEDTKVHFMFCLLLFSSFVANILYMDNSGE